MSEDHGDTPDLSRVGLTKGLFATSVVMLTSWVTIIVVMRVTGWEIEFARFVLSVSEFPSWFIVPAGLRDPIASTTFSGLLLGILVAVANAALWTAAGGVLAYACWRAWQQRDQIAPESPAAEDAVSTRYSPRLIAPTPGCSLSILDYSGNVIERPAPEAHLWLRRTPMVLPEGADDDDPITGIELALREVLEAHKDWSSGTEGHHGDTRLLAHSLEVGRKMVGAMPDEPLALTVGLAHDIGKILAYRATRNSSGEEIWERAVKNHSHLTIQVVRCLPEFHELSAQDREILIGVLASAHAPHLISRRSFSDTAVENRIQALTDTIRSADSITTREELTGASDYALTDEMVEELAEVLRRAVFEMNINGALNPEADKEGAMLSVHNYVAVMLQPLRTRIAPRVKESTQKSLGMKTNVVPRHLHSAAPAMIQALDSLGWLRRSHGPMTPDPPVFGVRVGFVLLKPVVLLDRGALAAANPEAVARWGESEHALRVEKVRAEGG